MEDIIRDKIAYDLVSNFAFEKLFTIVVNMLLLG